MALAPPAEASCSHLPSKSRVVHQILPASPTRQHSPPGYSPVHAMRTPSILRSLSIHPHTPASSCCCEFSIHQLLSSHTAHTLDHRDDCHVNCCHPSAVSGHSSASARHHHTPPPDIVGKMIFASLLSQPEGHKGICLVLQFFCWGQFQHLGG